MTVFSRLMYVFLGLLLGLLIISAILLPKQNFSIVDLWKFSVSPGIVALIAATIGARAGARSNFRAMEEDLARTYWSLMDLAAKDIEINLRLLEQVQKRVLSIQEAGRKPVFFELEPESAHTMFFEDIEYPKLRRVVPGDYTDEIFYIRNMQYVFERWNHLVNNYYSEKSLVHEDSETQIIDRLTTADSDRNFIASCWRALNGIARVKAAMEKKQYRKS